RGMNRIRSCDIIKNGHDGTSRCSVCAGLLILLFLASCAGGDEREPMGMAPLPATYHEELQEWKEYRIGVLTEPTGWLRMVDMIDLPEGEHTFGSSEDADLTFPPGTVPDQAGLLRADSSRVWMEPADEEYWRLDGETFQGGEIFQRGEEAPRVQSDRLHWFVDPQGDRLTLRLYDQMSTKAAEFEGFPFYDVDPEWHLEAKLVPWEEPRFVDLVTIHGEVVRRESVGELRFRANGETHGLIAFESSSGLFLMFSDHTGRTDTFPPMRYLITDRPDDEGWTVIDFNRAYNPPCAFSPFSTCQLPPPSNRLDLTIRAGEMRPTEPYAVTPPAVLQQ
ncbi:MAG: DUF1684 domain-containing protein, partial [Bacteroidota bacterium]